MIEKIIFLHNEIIEKYYIKIVNDFFQCSNILTNFAKGRIHIINLRVIHISEHSDANHKCLK